MQPEQPTPEQNTPPTPVESAPSASTPLTPAEIVAQAAQAPILPLAAPKKKSLVLPIVLMAWPGVAIILSIALYAILNLAMATSTPAPASGNEADLFGDSAPNPLRSIINVCLFLVGASAVGLGPISFIVGLVLLVMRIKK